MTRTRLLYGLLGVGSFSLMVFVWLLGEDKPDENSSIENQHSSGIQTIAIGSPAVSDPSSPAKHGYGHSYKGVFASELGYSPPTKIPANKEERIQAIYDALPRAEAEVKAVEILTGGMDAFSAAKYLETLHMHYGDFRCEVRAFAARAVAENPGDFDTLLFKTQRAVSNQERVAGYRQLYEMNPDSVEVLIGLGGALRSSEPNEAVVHLQSAILLAPEHPDAYYHLAVSYEGTGELKKALTAAEKAYENAPFWTTKAYVDYLKWTIENPQNQTPGVQ